MWTRKQFHSAIDRHVQGINDPLAPFNQVTDVYHKKCEECPDEKYEKCYSSVVIDPCEEVQKLIEEEYKAEIEAYGAMYRSWLETRYPEICGECPDLAKCDEPCEKVKD